MIIEFLQIQIPTDRASGTRTRATQMLTNTIVEKCSTPLTTASRRPNAVFEHPSANTVVFYECLNEYHIWFFLRVIGSSGENQVMPAFGGFVSATVIKPSRKSTLDYFIPSNEPFTDSAVVKELLRRSEGATDAVGQKYVLNTFALGGCMKALPIIWKLPEEFKRHVTPGSFHTMMNYLWMITWNKCQGSGYAEIL